MIYDLETHVKFGLTEDWSLSPDAIVWGEDGETIYLVMLVRAAGWTVQ